MSRAWSKKIEERYSLRLPADLRSWFDDEIWRRSGEAEFRHPLSPAELLDPPPGIIWAGFMLPDTLPIVGNRYGDWLCMRATADSRVAEVICWNHGGGDWIPYGKNLAEAILYDAVASLTSNDQPEVDDGHPAESDEQTVRWACDWLGRDNSRLRGFWKDGQPASSTPLQDLFNAGVSKIAIHRDRMLDHLNCPLKAGSDPKTAKQLNVEWEAEFVRWIFDTEQVPQSVREQLSALFTGASNGLFRQDWQQAEREALAAIELRQDLGWPFDVAGWAAERRGDFAQAIGFYERGLQTSLFADETVRFRTHWFPEGYGKFAAARLAELRVHVPTSLAADPYVVVFWKNDADSLRKRLCDYWLQQSQAATDSKQYLQACQCFYRAGWDCGLNGLDGFAEILEGIGRTAAAAGAKALSCIADLHLRRLPS